MKMKQKQKQEQNKHSRHVIEHACMITVQVLVVVAVVCGVFQLNNELNIIGRCLQQNEKKY